MKFFIDTANIQEIKEAEAMGILDGVTTNPSLIARENGAFKDILTEITKIVDGPISGEVLALDYNGMMKEAEELAAIHENIVVKIPLIKEGIKAVKSLTAMGIKTNVTLCFSPAQAILAAKAGATYISPFVGRLDDISHVGMDLVEQIAQIYDNYEYETEIIVASIRNPLHIIEAGMIGADIVTVPFNVIEQLFKHPLTDIGIEKFLTDSKKGK
ncbi:MAG: fructose-6-phosphate aldolase [Melioribacteraceae bacterium]|jgi:transaldolase|nr:fructose-6-phosphate aldolase [Melioribacteraceae bacterium]